MARRDRTGLVLVGVLVVVVVLALLAATALVSADAEVTAAQGALRREQSRAIAWSGVQAAMAELARQREAILAGRAPEVTESWTLFGEAAGAQGVVRLVELEPGRVIVPEAGKLDLNSASAEALAASGAIDRAAADAIVAGRGGSAYGSVAEAMAVTKPRGEVTTAFETSRPGAEPAGPGPAEAERLLTVFAFEPNTQMGVGGGTEGEARIYIGDGWREELKAELEARLPARAAAALEKALRAGPLKTMGEVIGGLRREQVAARDWAAVLDGVTLSPDAYLTGRVDVLTAPREVLRAVPGLNEQLAEQIERVRDRIDDEARLSVTWLVQQGALTAAQFQAVVDQVTCRSLQWRVRVEGGYGRQAAGPDGGPGTLRDRVVLEAVIDLSEERPRLAYLRDVTYLESAEVVEELAARAGEEAGAEAESELERAADLSLEAGMADVELEMDAGLEGGGGLDLSPMELSAGLDLGIGPSSEDDAAGPARQETPAGVDRRVGRWKIPVRAGGGSR